MANKKYSKTDEFFDMITHKLDVINMAITKPAAMMRYGYDDLIAFQDAKARHETRRAINRLVKQERLKIIKRGEKIYYQLTQEGVNEKIRRSILEKTKRLPRGEQCLVSFDIPEHVRSVRDAIRFLLKEAQFKQIHRSVWAGDRDIAHELTRYVHMLKATDWIKVFIARQIKK